MGFSPSQRVYDHYLAFMREKQLLDEHDGDQAWYTRHKERLLARTADGGREYTKMTIPQMATELIAMVIDECGDTIRARRKSRRKAG